MNERLLRESKLLATACRRALSASLSASGRASGGHYLLHVDENLVGCSVEDVDTEFASGAGRELESKMLAPWSSAALCVNSFCCWRSRSALDRLVICGVDNFRSIVFEKTYDHGIKGPLPHLDAELRRTAAGTVVVESKCLEPIDLALKRAVRVSPHYAELRRRRDPRADSTWYGALGEVHSFVFLDAFQLVRHFLGFARSGPEGPKTLVYLFWQPPDASHEIFARHREEVERFSLIVAGDPTCAFQASTYSDHWRELTLRRDKPPWIDDHVAVLRSRYDVDL